MDKLPHSLLLQILSRLDDSADVARCRVASKEFDAVFPALRSINLRCSPEWYEKVPASPRIKPLKTVFLDLISKLETVESVFIDLESLIVYLINIPRGSRDDDFSITDGDVAKEWLPRVSVSLKSLSILDFSSHRASILKSNVLPLISAYCHNLVNLELRCAWLSMHNMNPMPMLTSLTLSFTRLEDQHLNELNRFLHYLESALFLNEFENLRTLRLTSYYIGSFLSQFPITKTVEDLTLYSEHKALTVAEFTLGKVFAVFPNVTSLRINSVAWLDLEACLNTEGWGIPDGGKGLKKIHAYLKFVDPSLTFASVVCVLDQCVGLSEVSLLIHGGVVGTVSKGFMSKCMARWPGLKWRWGTWSELTEDSWITNTLLSRCWAILVYVWMRLHMLNTAILKYIFVKYSVDMPQEMKNQKRKNNKALVTGSYYTLQDTMKGIVYSKTLFALDERIGDRDAYGLDLNEELLADKSDDVD
ncbi:hypothetical protein SSX86_005938 [Deinandra increscens subsp. villosa]|uniref:F-box domain-containing protein n=1 Tax=Deinandra increscens subsp. villosa TaxID=3103831 RepID=A0AAP0DMS8_9ASTR